MPYFLDQNLEDEEKDPTQVQISGAAPTTEKDGSGDSTSQPSNSKQAHTGSGFQNLDKYLTTNQSQQFGQQVLGKVQGEVDSAKQGQANAADQFKSQVNTSNDAPTNQDVNQAIANPTSVDPAKYQEWDAQTYSGPKSLPESQSIYNQYWGGVNKANTSSQLLGTEPGRFTLLDSYFGRPNYSFGQKSLDNLLVQQSGLGKETRDVQNQAAQLKTDGDTQAKELQNEAATRSAQVDASREYARSALGLDDQGGVITGDGAGALGKQYSDVDSQVTSTNAARQAQIAQERLGLSQGNLTPDQINELGLSSGQGIYNLDLSQYLTPQSDLTKDQVMTPEQRSYIQALTGLAGLTDTYANGTATDPTSAYTIRKDDLQRDLSSAGSSYTSQSNALASQLADAQSKYNSLVGSGPATSPIGGDGLTSMDRRPSATGVQLNPEESNRLLAVIADLQSKQKALNDLYQPNRVLNPLSSSPNIRIGGNMAAGRPS